MPEPVKAAYGTREFYQEIGRRGGIATAAKRAAGMRNNVMAELQSIVADVAEKARQNASWSWDISRAISVGQVQVENDRLTCDLIVDLSIAPQAAAFEYGSGLQGEKGHTYRIEPKNAPFLAFQFGLHWLPGPKFHSMVGVDGSAHLQNIINRKGVATGLTFWNYVDHPGVEARPYLQPAIDAYRSQITSRLGKSFREAFVRGLFNET